MFKLVLTDISMPVVDGYEVCTQIMATQTYWFEIMRRQQSIIKFKTKRKIPVIAVTAYTDDSTRIKAMKVGMVELMHKPVGSEALQKVLNDYHHQ